MKAEYGYFGYVLVIFVWISMIATVWVSDKGNLTLTLLCGSVAILSTISFGIFTLKFVLGEKDE